jgi:hypothetical protein
VVSGAKYAGKWYFKIYCPINMKFYRCAFNYYKTALFSQRAHYYWVTPFTVNSSAHPPFGKFIFGEAFTRLIIFHSGR